MSESNQKRLAKEWFEKSKRYLMISRLAYAGTIVFGITAIIVAVLIKGDIKLFGLGVMLITLSFVWRTVESEWKNKVVEWREILDNTMGG